jgi:hypothetical protein
MLPYFNPLGGPEDLQSTVANDFHPELDLASPADLNSNTVIVTKTALQNKEERTHHTSPSGFV